MSDKPVVEHLGAEIPVDQIDLPPDEMETDLKDNKTNCLASAIRADGLIHPIVVRPSPTDPGRFLVVCGRRRLEAFRILKRETIPVVVKEGLSDEEARAMGYAENYMRAGLSPAQKTKALRVWLKRYKTTTYGTRLKQEFVAAFATPISRRKVRDRPNAPRGFAQEVVRTTNASERDVQRRIRAALALNEEQLDVLDERKVGAVEQETIASIADPEKRDRTMELIKAGTPPRDAIEQATGSPAKMTNGSQAPQAKTSEQPQSDEDWLATQCIPFRDKLKFKGVFDVQAIIYRKLRDGKDYRDGDQKGPLRKLHKALATQLKQVKAEHGSYGLLSYFLAKILTCAHPRDWLKCSPCDTTGHVDGKQCDDCHGAGFKLKFEQLR